MKDGKLLTAVTLQSAAQAESGEGSCALNERRRVLLMQGAVVVLIVLFAVPFFFIFSEAASSDLNSYILLVPVVACYLLWSRREKLPKRYVASPLAAMFLVLLGSAALGWSAFGSAGSSIIHNDWRALVVISFDCFLAAAGFLFLGRAWMAAATFPFVFLILMAPIPDGMVNLLETASQHASAAAADLFFRLGNTPFLHEGLVFQLPNITLEVAQECSGIRSSLVLFITSLLAASLFLRTTWKRLLFVAFVIPLGVLRNGFRIWVIGVLCVHFGPQMIHSPIHLRGGPIFFGLSLIPLFFLLVVLRRGAAEKRSAASPVRIGAAE